jgi:hypothetical protein
MPRFLIEVPHESEPMACARAAKGLLELGSHFVTHADFGCNDGVHSAWIVVDGEDKAEVRGILPPPFRSAARIVGLNKFTLQHLDELLKSHQS